MYFPYLTVPDSDRTALYFLYQLLPHSYPEASDLHRMIHPYPVVFPYRIYLHLNLCRRSYHSDLLNLCRQLAFIDISHLPQIRELVNLFISEGADVNHQNAAGETALMLCCRDMLLGDASLDRLKLGIARLLLDHQADPSLRDKYGRTVLQQIGNRSNNHLHMVLKNLPELNASPLPKKRGR